MGRRLAALLCLGLPVLALAAAKPAQRKAAGDPALARRVTVSAAGMPLQEYIGVLSKQTRVNFLIGPGLEKEVVTAGFKDAPLSQALDALKKQGLGYRPIAAGSGPSYAIGKGLDQVADPPAGFSSPQRECALPATPITLDAGTGMPLPAFFERLGKLGGVRFVLGPGLEERKFSGRFDEHPLNEVLEVLAGMKGLSCARQSDGSYLIGSRPAP